MSITVEGVSARGYLASWAQFVSGMTVADMKAIPADKWTATFGGATRSPNAAIADVITLLRWITATMKGEESAAYNDMESLTGECADIEFAIATLMAEAATFGETLNACSDERLNEAVPAPWGMPTPIYMLALIAVNHIWYHDGQLNYVQCLLGDDKVHWMGE